MKSKPTLQFCLIMDIIGSASYFIPGVGEWTDIAWAPISAYIFYRSFGGKTGAIGSIINFTEELLPFIDFIPTFTIAFLIKKLKTINS
ncbi:MAG: hypothetical protein GZ091_07405 [Paludibacter sp.]|nr:hypothetical protein [Paludibacter sp.]